MECQWGGYEGGAIPPGGSFVYEFIAQPYGVFPYHCHVNPVADHINRGLYGMMIIDPKVPRAQMTEFVMLMNGYDLNFEQEGPVTIPTVDESNNDQVSKSPVLKISHDNHLQGDGEGLKDKQLKQAVQLKSDGKDSPVNRDAKSSNANKGDQNSNIVQDKSSSSKGDAVKKGTETQKNDNQGGSTNEADSGRDNEIYTVNGKAFDYMIHPITLQTGKSYRIYLVNMLEFDLVNSFHLHGYHVQLYCGRN